MNKKIIILVAVAVIASLLLMLGIERLFLPLVDHSHNLGSDIIEVVATLLFLPVRLYAFFIYHDHGSWPLPMLILLVALSALMWGVIVERIVSLYSKRKHAQCCYDQSSTE